MTNEQIFELAEKCGFQDDYGRWNFTSEDLLDFVYELRKEATEVTPQVTPQVTPEVKWVGLTDDEGAEIWGDAHDIDWKRLVTPKEIVQRIEAKLKEKNT